MLKRSEIEGIYYSNKTGRMFEAVSDGHGYVITRYCDDASPQFGPCVVDYIFRMHHFMDIYETIISYTEDDN